MIVRSAFVHDGAPRELVHRLKFEGVTAAAQWLAVQMAPLIQHIDGVLVPIPRTTLRLLRYGIDTAFVIAKALGELSDRRVERRLRASVWAPRHTDRSNSQRSAPTFFGGPVLEPVVLVDDVVTTGSTLTAAGEHLGGLVALAVTATRSQKVTSLIVGKPFELIDQRYSPDRR